MNTQQLRATMTALDSDSFARAAIDRHRTAPGSITSSTPLGGSFFSSPAAAQDPFSASTASTDQLPAAGAPNSLLGFLPPPSARSPSDASSVSGLPSVLASNMELANLHPLQQVVTSLLRAVVFLSEDLKAMKTETTQFSSSTTDKISKLNAEQNRLRRSLEDDYLRKKEYSDMTSDVMNRLDRLQRGQTESRGEEARNQDILLGRIAQQEISLADLSKTVQLVSSSCAKTAEVDQMIQASLAKYSHMQDGLLGKVLAISEASQKDQARLLQTAEKLDRFEASATSTMSDLSASIETLTKKVFSTVETVEMEMSVIKGLSARVQHDAAKFEIESTTILNNAVKAVVNTVETKLSDQLVLFEKQSSSVDNRLTHMSQILDVRVEALREHLLSLENEVGDIRSEVSVFNSNVHSVGSTGYGRVSSLEERIDAAVNRLEDKQQQFRAKQLELSDQSEQKAQRLLDELTLRIDSNARESEKSLKSYFSSLQRSHDSAIVQDVYEQVNQQVQAAVDAKVEGELRRLDEKHRKLREKQLESEGQTEQKAQKILEEISSRVATYQQETERRLRSLLSSNATTTLTTIQSEVEQKNRSVEVEIEALRRFCEDSTRRASQDARTCCDDVQRALSLVELLYDVLCIDRNQVPRDPASFPKFVRSLPWMMYTSGGGGAAPPSSSAFFSQRDPTASSNHRNTSPERDLRLLGGARRLSSSPPQPSTATLPPPLSNMLSPALGLEVVDWNSGYGEFGVQVAGTTPDGVAARCGIQKGDIIISVGDVHVQNVSEFSLQIRKEMDMGLQPRLGLYELGRENSSKTFAY